MFEGRNVLPALGQGCSLFFWQRVSVVIVGSFAYRLNYCASFVIYIIGNPAFGIIRSFQFLLILQTCVAYEELSVMQY
jgi:hypothetical protein